MKITASRRDDILKEKKSYDTAMQEYNDSYEQYNQSNKRIEDALAEYISADLAKFNLLDLDVTVRLSNFDNTAEGKDYLILINCDESRKFEDSSALSWSYRVELSAMYPNLNVTTNSWSGLSATTSEQLASLRQTVECLECLNTFDWQKMLDTVAVPAYRDNVSMRPTTRNFAKELLAIDLEELVGTDTLVRVDTSWHTAYYHLLRSTDTQFVLSEINLDRSEVPSLAEVAEADKRAYRKDKKWLYRQIDADNLETYQPEA